MLNKNNICVEIQIKIPGTSKFPGELVPMVAGRGEGLRGEYEAALNIR